MAAGFTAVVDHEALGYGAEALVETVRDYGTDFVAAYNDTIKLLRADNSPTFDTMQSLTLRLSTMLGLGDAERERLRQLYLEDAAR